MSIAPIIFGVIVVSLQKTSFPVKNNNKNELNDVQKQHNKEESSKRIYVEHSIGGMKRYTI